MIFLSSRRLIALVASASACFLATATTPRPAHAQFAVEEEEDDHGVLGGADFSFRYYKDALRRFPERAGIICVAAYELDKTGRHDQSIAFFRECARAGNPPAMIYLALMHELGLGTPVDPMAATDWLRRAAETGYSLGQYHYGMALLRGTGVTADAGAARLWLARAADQGDVDAAAALSGLDVGQ